MMTATTSAKNRKATDADLEKHPAKTGIAVYPTQEELDHPLTKKTGGGWVEHGTNKVFPDLRTICKWKKLPTTGSAVELKQRILDAAAAWANVQLPAPPEQ